MARFLDGRVVKGMSIDIDANKPTFHVSSPGAKAVEIRLTDLKALFFVRSLEGDPGRSEDIVPKPGDVRARGANVVSLKFADGETMVGMTMSYPPRPFFFLSPVDPKSNNIRILVNRAAVVEMEQIPQP